MLAFLSVALFIITLVPASSYRLPGSLAPKRYDLEIITNLGDEHGKFEFNGNVCIDAEVLESTDNITLHGTNLEMNHRDMKVNDKHIKGFKYIEKDDFIVMDLGFKLQKDESIRFCMKFRGNLDEVLSGFYKSKYDDKMSGKVKYLATTQFEPTDARRAFPCFDEPAFKATFAISIGHKDNYTAISNMPVMKQEAMHKKPGWVWTRFEETVPMSTYLVAYIVSEFGHVTAPKSKGNTTFRIWSRKDALDQVDLATKVGPKSLDYYEKFFGIDYPLPKQDMIAIPDFSSGAMENWGLITYRETYLLYDNEKSTTNSKHRVASVIAHELAHQWFGNLVTMKWWTDLWLNEGFATYMASLAVEHLYPEWNSLEEDTVAGFLSVLSLDSLKTSHAISVPLSHPSRINEIFDTISYKKGSFILRMMSLFLGEEVLRKGVKDYLLEHKYANAEQDDLWYSLTHVAHNESDFPKDLTVKMVMDTWTLQVGYPLVTVNSKELGKLEIRQKRFLRDTLVPKSDNMETWWVPISYTTQSQKDFNNSKPKYWLPATDEVQTITLDKNPKDWVIFNINSAGLFRVNYDLENWNLLVDFLKGPDYKQIATINRIQLIDDSAQLAWVNQLPYDVFFNLLDYVRENENLYLVWRAVLSNLQSVYQQVKFTRTFDMMQIYMEEFLTPIYKTMGSLTEAPSENENGPLHSAKHKALIMRWACRFNVLDCVSQAKHIFREYQKDPKNDTIIPKDLRSVILCTALRHGDQNDWEFLWEQYKNANVASVKAQLLYNLACTREVWMLRRLLDWSINPTSGIRKQDFPSVFAEVANNEIGFFIAKDFLVEKIDDVYQYVQPNAKRLGRLLSPMAAQIHEQGYADWFGNFTEMYSKYFSEVRQSVSQAKETIKVNIQWHREHAEKLRGLFESRIKRDIYKWLKENPI